MPSTDDMFSLTSSASGEDRSPSVQKRTALFVFHGLAATFPSFVIGFIAVGTMGSGPAPHPGLFRQLATAVIYALAFWGSAFLLGLVINDHMRNRSACWVGVVGVVSLVLFVLADAWSVRHYSYYANCVQGHYWKYEYSQFFALDSSRYCGSDGFGQLFITTPVLSSIAYSIGAWLALRFGKRKTADHQDRDPRTDA